MCLLIFLLLGFFYSNSAVTQNIKFFSEPDSKQDSIIVSGQVLGGNPLTYIQGVQLYCEDKSCSAISDSLGNFTIVLKETNTSLIISHQSFNTYTIKGPFHKNSLNKKIVLEKKIIELNMVEISENINIPEVEEKIINSKKIQFLQAKEINATSIADVLDNEHSIFVQKTQGAGGSPIIHGLAGNKILLMVDGIRLNNAIYRGRHLQNSISLDESIIKHIDIIYGPSAIYGSDALGGVIHVKTKDAVIGEVNNKSNFFGNGYIKSTTATNELTSHLDFNLGMNKLASLSSITLKNFGDIKKGQTGNQGMGDVSYIADTLHRNDTIYDIILNNQRKYIQKQTGYTQLALLQKFNFLVSEKITTNINIQYNEQYRVNRFDKLQEEIDSISSKYAEWYYAPQRRFMIANNWKMTGTHVFFSQFDVNLSYQNIQEGRTIRRFQNVNRIIERDALSIYGINLHFVKPGIGYKKHIILYGLESIFENLSSTAYNQDVITLNKIRTLSRYPDGSMYSHGGTYANLRINVNSSISFNTGARISYVNLFAPLKSDIYFQGLTGFENVRQSSIVPSGNLGALFKSKGFVLTTNISTGFRAPNIDDLSKIGEGSGKMFEIPNPDLKPEYISTADLELSFTNDKNLLVPHLSGVVYYSRLFDAIIRVPAELNGASFFVENADTMFYYHQTNTGIAYIYGLTTQLNLLYAKSWQINSGLNYTKGLDISQNEPLTGIPPLKIKLAAKKIWRSFETTLETIYNAAKKREDLSSVEIKDPRIPVNGNSSWIVFNIRNNFFIGENSRLNFAIENILDANYRMFSSGINQPGRNFMIAYYFKF